MNKIVITCVKKEKGEIEKLGSFETADITKKIYILSKKTFIELYGKQKIVTSGDVEVNLIKGKYLRTDKNDVEADNLANVGACD